jgi:hypothetical protein
VIYNFKYSNYNSRGAVIDYLKENNFGRSIDLGATLNGWSKDFTTHYDVSW